MRTSEERGQNLQDLHFPTQTSPPSDSTHSSIRLKIVTQFYPPDYAATGQLVQELVQHLGQPNLHIEVFTGQPGYAFDRNSAAAIETSDYLKVKRSRTSRIWPKRIRGKAVSGFLFCLRSALHLIRRFRKTDLLLITTAPPFLPILGYFANRLFKLPYVCLIYDLYPDIATELGVVSPNHWLVRSWERLNRCTWHQAQHIIVLSSTMKDRIVAKYPEGRDKISVIHNWADPRHIVPIPKADNWFARQHHLIEPFTVLYSGNMGRCHDLDTILNAAQQLKDEPIRFVFIGSGAKRQPLIDQVQQRGLTNFLFLPYQDKSVLPYSLTACDLSLVSISPGMEGLVAPSKLYSALASGRPIAAVCEPHSYLRQLLDQADCGSAFDNGDGTGLANFLYRLSRNPARATAMGEAGRRYFQAHFTPDIIANHYFSLLQQSLRSLTVPASAPLDDSVPVTVQSSVDLPS